MVRLKQRYILFNIIYPDSPSPSSSSSALTFSHPTDAKLTPQALAHLLREQIQANFGDWGSGVVAATLNVKYFSHATSTGILRVTRQHFRLAWAALTFVTEILGRGCVIKVVRVSGTIKKAEMEVIKRGRAGILATSGSIIEP
ncbi:RNA-binding protein pop5 [Saitoella coloradoensis]